MRDSCSNDFLLEYATKQTGNRIDVDLKLLSKTFRSLHLLTLFSELHH